MPNLITNNATFMAWNIHKMCSVNVNNL